MVTESWTVEVTDTFAGEANYSWINRAEFSVPKGATQRQIVTAAKAAIGYTGVRCKTESYGDSYTLRPIGMCVIMFIN